MSFACMQHATDMPLPGHVERSTFLIPSLVPSFCDFADRIVIANCKELSIVSLAVRVSRLLSIQTFEIQTVGRASLKLQRHREADGTFRRRISLNVSRNRTAVVVYDSAAVICGIAIHLATPHMYGR